MVRSRSPTAVIVTMALLGTVGCAVVRFAYSAYVISQEGVGLNAIPMKPLLMDVMGLHWFALYGLVGGTIFGIILVLTDLLRSGGRDDDYASRRRVDIDPDAADEVKLRRMEIGDRYLKENPPDNQKGSSE